MSRSGWIFGFALAAFGCEAEPVGGRQGVLTVRTPQAVIASVGTYSAEATPLTPAILRGVGDGPYTVTARAVAGGGALGPPVTLLDVPGPVLDLAAVLPSSPPVAGPLISLYAVPVPAGADEAVAISGGQRVPGIRSGEGWRFDVPAYAPVTLLAVWRRGAQAVKVGRREVPDPTLSAQLLLAVDAQLDTDAYVAVELPALPAGWVTGELTWDGVRTGLRLGEGLAGYRRAVAVPRPEVSDEGWAKGGLWVEAVARPLGGGEPLAMAGAHLGLETSEISLRWPAPIEVNPALGDPSRPGDLSARRALRFGEAADDATWRGVSLRGEDGCRTVEGRIIGAPDGDLALPATVVGDPLAAPIVFGRVEVLSAGLSYADALGVDPLEPTTMPRQAPRFGYRAVEGVWQTARCVQAHPAAGRYAVYDEAESCEAGGLAAQVIVGRCGDVVPLEGAVALGCGRLNTTDQAGWLWSEDGDAIAVQVGAQRWRLEHMVEPAAVPSTALAGDWHRVTLTEQMWVDGQPNSEALLLASTEGRDGPALRFEETGAVRVVLPTLHFEAALLQFGGAEGAMEVRGSSCRAEPRRWTVTLEDGALRMVEDVPEAEGVRRRTIGAWRAR